MIKFIYGNESYLVERAWKNQIKNMNLNYQLFEDKISIEDINNNLITYNLFQDKNLVILKNIDTFSNSKNFDELIKIVEKNSAFNEIIFVSDQKIRSNNKLFKYLLKNAKIEKQDFPQNNFEASVLLKNIVNSKGGEISTKSSLQMVEILPKEIKIYINEVNKLLLINNKIDSKLIEKNLSSYSSQNQFALSSFLAEKDFKSFILDFEQRVKQGELASFILSSIVKNLSDLTNIKYRVSVGQSNYQISTDLLMNPYRVKILKTHVNNFNLNELKTLFLKLTKILINVRKGKIMNEKQVLNTLIIEILK